MLPRSRVCSCVRTSFAKALRKLRPSVSNDALEELAELVPELEAKEAAVSSEAEQRINKVLEQHVAEDAAWRRADARGLRYSTSKGCPFCSRQCR